MEGVPAGKGRATGAFGEVPLLKIFAIDCVMEGLEWDQVGQLADKCMDRIRLRFIGYLRQELIRVVSIDRPPEIAEALIELLGELQGVVDGCVFMRKIFLVDVEEQEDYYQVTLIFRDFQLILERREWFELADIDEDWVPCSCNLYQLKPLNLDAQMDPNRVALIMQLINWIKGEITGDIARLYDEYVNRGDPSRYRHCTYRLRGHGAPP
jgi:hypothetical protein